MRATIDDAQIHSVPREFGRGGESDRTGADDQNLLHRRSTLARDDNPSSVCQASCNGCFIGTTAESGRAPFGQASP